MASLRLMLRVADPRARGTPVLVSANFTAWLAWWIGFLGTVLIALALGITLGGRPGNGESAGRHPHGRHPRLGVRLWVDSACAKRPLRFTHDQ
jgi:hypothetical protein